METLERPPSQRDRSLIGTTRAWVSYTCALCMQRYTAPLTTYEYLLARAELSGAGVRCTRCLGPIPVARLGQTFTFDK